MQDPNKPSLSGSSSGTDGRGSGTATADYSRDDSFDTRQKAADFKDQTNDETSDLKDQTREKASDLKDAVSDKASEYGSKLAGTADSGIDKAADGLEKAAVQLRSRSEDGGVQGQVGTRVADGLDKTSQYLRDHEAQEIWSDVEQFVKDHPLQAAAGAAVAGYVVAKLMK